MNPKKTKTDHRVYLNQYLIAQLHASIDKPIMNLRLQIQKSTLTTNGKTYIDANLDRLSRDLWKEIASILKIKNP